jgi:hypothetical protein
VQTILDAPMTAVQSQQLGRVGLLHRQVGKQIDALVAGSGGGDGEDFAFEAGDLLEVGKLQVGVESGTGPNAAGLDPAVAFIDAGVLRGEQR